MENIDKIILENEALVRAIVRQYRGYHVDHDDLMQEGRIGLLQALRRYSPSHQVKFESYASWWIHRYIRAAIAKYGFPVSFPKNQPLPTGIYRVDLPDED